MKDLRLLIIILLLAMVLVSVSKSEAYGIFEREVTQGCNGFHGECYDQIEGMSPMMMSAGKSRSRNLRVVEYISYEALRKDSIACGQRGNSYYNCNIREKANPYTRGCSAITHCARFTD